MSAGAAAFVFDEEGRLLVAKENYGKYRWTIPGGSLEPGETPQDGVVRETREETGALVAVDHLVGIYRLSSGFQSHAFRCEIVEGEPRLLDTGELSAVEWLPPREIPEPRTNLLHHAMLDALAGARGVVRDNLPRLT